MVFVPRQFTMHNGWRTFSARGVRCFSGCAPAPVTRPCDARNDYGCCVTGSHEPPALIILTTRAVCLSCVGAFGSPALIILSQGWVVTGVSGPRGEWHRVIWHSCCELTSPLPLSSLLLGIKYRSGCQNKNVKQIPYKWQWILKKPKPQKNS